MVPDPTSTNPPPPDPASQAASINDQRLSALIAQAALLQARVSAAFRAARAAAPDADSIVVPTAPDGVVIPLAVAREISSRLESACDSLVADDGCDGRRALYETTRVLVTFRCCLPPEAPAR